MWTGQSPSLHSAVNGRIRNWRDDLRVVQPAMSKTFFLLAFCFCTVGAHAQYRPPEKYVQLRKPDQAEGKKVLEEFRTKLVIVGYYDFQLHILPRRGAEKVIDGKLWAGRKDGAQLLRIDFTGGTKERFLIQSGEAP